MKLTDAVKIIPQYLLPHHFLSSIMHSVTRSKTTYIKNFAIRTVIKLYDVDMKDALVTEPTAYPSFNHFFTRQLKPSARPICQESNAVVSPVDGKVSQLGKINESRIFQAKGHHYTIEELLGDTALAACFKDGKFATLYLSPRDYHRIHAPLTGKLRQMIHIPGKLFSVNRVTTENVPGLFARNERVVTVFDTDAGPMAAVLVGAIFVSSMDTVWAGTITPPYGKEIRKWDYRDKNFNLHKGDELGRFNMGSTVILLFPKNTTNWNNKLKPGSEVIMGRKIGELIA